jgi:HTH-type transcriptional regulator/antitoxin HigA
MAVQPRPVTTNEEARSLVRVIDALIDRPEALNDDEQQFLALLGNLLGSWEDEQYPAPTVSPLQLIRSLMEENGLRQQDLVGRDRVFPSPGVASEVLNGKRRLTYAYVERLAQFFHVSPALFFDQALEPKP